MFPSRSFLQSEMNRLICSLLLSFLTFIFTIVWGLEEYLSLEEVKNISSMIFTERRSNDFQQENFGILKSFTFDEKYAFIGARNRVYRISLKDFEMTSSEDLSKIVSWNCFPSETRSYSYILGMRDNITKKLTYDTCLSYSERMSAVNSTAFQTKSSGSKCYSALNESIPGNLRYNSGLIRFHKELEEYACDACFIRGIEKIKNRQNEDVLWVCGSFGSFSKAFHLNPKTLEVIPSTYDVNIPSCARYPDETMATRYTDNGRLFAASGWGIYQPASDRPDAPYNNSTMLYSDWRMLWNGLHWPTRMATVLGSDVRFIPRTYQTKHYIYFFGSEVNPQYSYINSMSRQSYSSFMLRICKNDTGANYTAQTDGEEIRKQRDYLKQLWSFWTAPGKSAHFDETAFSYSSRAWGDTYHLPTKIFTSALKFPFGCYLKRYDGAQSLNAFWGQQNIVYFNRLADLVFSFDWTYELKMIDRHVWQADEYKKYVYRFYGLLKKTHDWVFDPSANVYNSMIAAFSSNGVPNNDQNGWFQGTQPSGAVCQFQVSEWKMDHLLNERKPSPPDIIFRLNWEHWKNFNIPITSKDPLKTNFPKNFRQYMKSGWKIDDKDRITPVSQREEFLALYSSFKTSFFSRGSVWLQGLNPPHRPGIDFMSVPKFNESQLSVLKDAARCGQCLGHEQLKDLEKNVEEFEKLMNFSSTAWPTDWQSHLTKMYDGFFHMNPMSVAGDNASFVMDNVEFAKMFVFRQNFTYFNMTNEFTEAPLVYLILISTVGDVFRVVMCDLVSISIRKTKCEMRNTDQPYITKSRQTMRINNKWKGEFDKRRQIRVSSLLSTWRLATPEDRSAWERMNPQSPIMKDAFFEESKQRLILLTSTRVIRFSLTPKVICASYRTCVGCASDPLCYWKFTLDKEKPLPFLNGRCQPIINGSLSQFELNATVSDVFGRGEQCQNFIHKEMDFIPKVMCLSKNDSTNGTQMMTLKCLFRPLFRGFFKWQMGRSETEMLDIDFEESDEMYIQGPDQSLIISRPQAPSMLYQCIGINFDNESATTVLAKFSLKVLEINDKFSQPQVVITNCFCNLWQQCCDIHEEGNKECENLMKSHQCSTLYTTQHALYSRQKSALLQLSDDLSSHRPAPVPQPERTAELEPSNSPPTSSPPPSEGESALRPSESTLRPSESKRDG